MGRKVAVNFILGLDCIYDLSEPLEEAVAPASLNPHELPAPIFALEASTDARAGVPFSLNAWVGLTDPLHAHDEILADSFHAELDPHAGTIVVTGRLRRVTGEPAAAGPRIQRALIVGIRVVAPAGMYSLQIPPTHYAADAALPMGGADIPPARAVQWLQVRP